MGIIIRLDQVMSNRKIKLLELAEKIGITYANLSNLKNSKVTTIRFSTLENICKELECQPGDILEYIDDDVIKFIEGFSKNNTQKETALNKLYAYAKINGKKTLNIELAKECFGIKKDINIEQIQKAVAEYFKLSPEELISNIRKQEIVKARQLAIYICRTQTTASFKEIAKAFNINELIQVIFSSDKISDTLKEDSKLKQDYEKIIKELK